MLASFDTTGFTENTEKNTDLIQLSLCLLREIRRFREYI